MSAAAAICSMVVRSNPRSANSSRAAATIASTVLALFAVAFAVYLRLGTVRRPPVEVAMPVSGRWLAYNSPGDRVPSHHLHAYGQTYAIDLVHDPAGRPRPGLAWWPLARRPDDFPGFGRPVLAPADATVVRAHDRERDTGAAPRRWPCSTWSPRAWSASCWGRGGSSATTWSSTSAAGSTPPWPTCAGARSGSGPATGWPPASPWPSAATPATPPSPTSTSSSWTTPACSWPPACPCASPATGWGTPTAPASPATWSRSPPPGEPSGTQPVAVGEQGVVVAVADVDRLLLQGPRPGHGQAAGEGAPAEQDVGHALALAAGQPGGDQGVHLAKLVGEDQRPARDDHDHAPVDAPADPVDGGPVGVVEPHGLGFAGHAVVLPQRPADVAEALGVRGLAHDHDADVGPGRGGRGVLAEGDLGVWGDLADAVQDGVAGDDVTRQALPGHRPAAGLVADVVGVAAGDVDALVARQGQDLAVVLQQHLGLGNGPAGQGPVGRGADLVQVPAVGEGVLEQPQLELLDQDAPHGVVDPGLGHPPGRDLGQQGGLELLVAVGLHEHVDAGVHARPDLGGVVAGELVDALPVRDHEPVEAELVLQDPGDELAVGVHLERVPDPVLGPVDAGERRHHAADVVAVDGGHVRRQVDAGEVGPAGDGDALVDGVVARPGAVLGVAVAGVVLGRGQDPVGLVKLPGPRALESVDGRLHLDDQPRVLAEALVGPAPAQVPGHAHAGSEHPLGAGGPGLFGGHVLDPLDQPRVAGGAEPDVVGEHGRPDQVAVAVDGVDAVDERDPQLASAARPGPGRRRPCRPSPRGCCRPGSSRRPTGPTPAARWRPGTGRR